MTSAAEGRCDGAPQTPHSGKKRPLVRRLLVCVGVAAFAPFGSISVGSFAGGVVVVIVLAVIAWMIWGMLDDADRQK